MAWIGGIVGAVAPSLMQGIFGNSNTNGSGGYNGGYMPPNMNQAANSELSTINGLSNPYGNAATQNQFAQYAGQQYNNPYQSQFQGNINNVAQQGMGVGQQNINTGQMLQGQIPTALGAGNAILQTSFDPQSQLYNYLQNQNQQQSLASESAQGVANSPFGAGLTNQSNQLFNMNWQNQQLARQVQGIQGMSQANSSANSLGSTGSNLGSNGLNIMGASAALPYQTQNSIAQNNMGALGAQTQFQNQSNAMPQQQIQDYNNYQGLGSPSAQLGLGNAYNNAYGAIGGALGTAAGSLYNGGNSNLSGIFNNWTGGGLNNNNLAGGNNTMFDNLGGQIYSTTG